MKASRSNRRALHSIGSQGTLPVSKYYLIGSRGKILHIKHGRADVRRGKIIPITERKILKPYRSDDEAMAALKQIVNAKKRKGYIVTPTNMRPALSVFADKRKRKASKKLVSLRQIAKQVAQVEGFNVGFFIRSGKSVRKARSDRGGLRNYTGRFQRRLANTKRFTDWKRLRFYNTYPRSIIVKPLDPTGYMISGNPRLKAIRQKYEKLT